MSTYYQLVQGPEGLPFESVHVRVHIDPQIQPYSPLNLIDWASNMEELNLHFVDCTGQHHSPLSFRSVCDPQLDRPREPCRDIYL